MALASKTRERCLRTSPLTSQVAIHAERTGGGLFRRGGESAEEEMHVTCMRIVAGVALHGAIEQRHVARTVNRTRVGGHAHADIGGRGGIRIHEVDGVLPGQVSYCGVAGHKVCALRDRLERSVALSFVPGIDRYRAVMAA